MVLVLPVGDKNGNNPPSPDLPHFVMLGASRSSLQLTIARTTLLSNLTGLMAVHPVAAM